MFYTKVNCTVGKNCLNQIGAITNFDGEFKIMNELKSLEKMGTNKIQSQKRENEN